MWWQSTITEMLVFYCSRTSTAITSCFKILPTQFQSTSPTHVLSLHKFPIWLVISQGLLALENNYCLCFFILMWVRSSGTSYFLNHFTLHQTLILYKLHKIVRFQMFSELNCIILCIYATISLSSHLYWVLELFPDLGYCK